MKDKHPFRFLRKWRDPQGRMRCEYEASFWEGPCEPGQAGRYVRHKCADVVMNGRFANTSPGVSYYDELRKAVIG